MAISAFISLLNFLASLFVGILVYSQSSRKPVHKLFIIQCLLVAYTGFVEFMLRQSETSTAALLWLKANWIWPLILPVTFHFAVLFTRRSSFFQKSWALILIYAPAGLLATFWLLAPDLFIGDVVKQYWGYNNTPPIHLYFLPLLIFINVLGYGAPILVTYHYFSLHPSKEKTQTKYVAIGLIAPAVLSLSIFIPAIINKPFPPLTTAGGFFTNIVIGYAIWRYDLFGLNPATAAENIISTMSDLVILLTPEGNVATINRAVTDLLGYRPHDLSGGAAKSIFASEGIEAVMEKHQLPAGRQALDNVPVQNLKGSLFDCRGTAIPASIAISILTERDGSTAGYVIIARDMTVWKQAELEREKLIAELREALANIKTLRGLIPICSSCKKVRNDQGYWQRVEEYVQEHSEIGFSHGICESCAKELYPEFINHQTLKPS